MRFVSTSPSSFVREIIIKEEGKTVTIEGRAKQSPRKKQLIDGSLFKVAACGAHEDCHPLCKFDSVHEIKHTGIV